VVLTSEELGMQPSPPTPGIFCRISTTTSEMPGLVALWLKCQCHQKLVEYTLNMSSYFIVIIISAKMPLTYALPGKSCKAHLNAPFQGRLGGSVG